MYFNKSTWKTWPVSHANKSSIAWIDTLNLPDLAWWCVFNRCNFSEFFPKPMKSSDCWKSINHNQTVFVHLRPGNVAILKNIKSWRWQSMDIKGKFDRNQFMVNTAGNHYYFLPKKNNRSWKSLEIWNQFDISATTFKSPNPFFSKSTWLSQDVCDVYIKKIDIQTV